MGEQEPVLGEKIARLLKDRGLDQTWLAEQVGVSQAAVSKWIGGATPGPPAVFLIEDAFELAPGALSRSLGYLPLDAAPAVTPEDAIRADMSLSDEARELLLAALRAARGADRRDASRRR